MFRKYVAVVWGFWKARISGWSFAVIGLLSSVASALLTHYHAGQQTLDQVLKWSAGVSLTAAIVVILQSQYEAWREEYKARCRAEDELRQLNSGGDLRGEITIYPQDFAPDFVPNPHNTDEDAITSILKVSCWCANHGQKECEIGQVAVVVKHPAFRTYNRNDHDELTVILNLNEPLPLVAPRKTLTFNATLYVSHLSPEQLIEADLQAYLIDSLGIKYHKFTVKKVVTNVIFGDELT